MSIHLTRPFVPWTQPPYREIAALFGRPETKASAEPATDLVAQHEFSQAARAIRELKREQLTVKQRAFVDAYMSNGFDEFQAAIAAGWSEDEAYRVSKKMLEKGPIREIVELELTLYAEKSTVRLSAIEDEIRAIAFSNIGEFINEIGEAYDELDPTHPRMRAVKKYVREPTRYGYKTTIELHDKLGALTKLATMKQASLAGGADGAKGERGGDTIVNVGSINIIPVPQGQFLPAPEKKALAPLVLTNQPRVIDITPINSSAHQAGALTRTEAAVPVQAGS